jgi:hypothetical protein
MEVWGASYNYSLSLTHKIVKHREFEYGQLYI